jgi:formiminotetrahydrofolate cyclodeaminase
VAKSKTLPKLKDLRAHFFMSIRGNHVDIIYHDETDNGAAIGAALASLMEEDAKLFDIFSAAFLTVMTTKEEKSNWERVKFPKKEKSISKTPVKAVKTPVKAVKRK